MDCSKTEVFFNELIRMCTFTDEKTVCPLKKEEQSCGYDCYVRIFQNREKAIKIVQEWSDSHPVKTRLSVLKEAFPNVVLNHNDVPTSCAGALFGKIDCGAVNNNCVACWNTPIEDGENNE